jgi:RimJ/RimL family protein N-acetyltransferase
METKRLSFRQIEQSDFNHLKEIISDEETMKYYPNPYNDDGVQRWIDWCQGCYKKRGFGLFAVILKESNTFIGDCGITLQNINGKEVFEIGYHLNKKYWHKGYASEASQFMKDYFFKNTEYNEVYSYMNKENYPSRNVAIRNGMLFEEEYIEDDVLHVVYKITREQWEIKK